MAVRASHSNARRLRKQLTPAESLLWQKLRMRQCHGWKFRRQHPIGAYIVDFVCPKAALIIEADGGQHAESQRDTQRDQWLQQEGYRIVRFWNHEILANIEGVLQAISAALLTTPSPLRGEGRDGGAPPPPNLPHQGGGINELHISSFGEKTPS